MNRGARPAGYKKKYKAVCACCGSEYEKAQPPKEINYCSIECGNKHWQRRQRNEWRGILLQALAN